MRINSPVTVAFAKALEMEAGLSEKTSTLIH